MDHEIPNPIFSYSDLFNKVKVTEEVQYKMLVAGKLPERQR